MYFFSFSFLTHDPCRLWVVVPLLLVPASPTPSHIQGPFSVRSLPLEVHWEDIKLLVGYPVKETSHSCWVTWMVFSDACSGATCAGHHLPCPLLTTVLAKLHSQTEWVSPPESQLSLRSAINFPFVGCLMLDQNCLRQGRWWDYKTGHHESMVWRATDAETVFIMQ